MVLNTARKTFLGGMEFLYRFAEGFHHRYHTSHPGLAKRLKARVISVGNISWGGSGKTPLVIMLAHALESCGKKVAVLTRGYGKDENRELEIALKGIPVLVGRDRIQTGQKAVSQFGAEVILLDDGFQHRRLHRDLDIVAINATHPFGDMHLIPRGILREPVERLSRAHAIVLNQSFLGRHNVVWIKQKIRQVNPQVPIFEGQHRPIGFFDLFAKKKIPLAVARQKHLATLAGIEDPHSFEKVVSRLGGQVEFSARFRDHHWFDHADIQKIIQNLNQLRIRILVTTRKDSFRLEKYRDDFMRARIQVWALQIQLSLDDEDALLRLCLPELQSAPAVS